MDFAFTDEQLAIREAVRRYGTERLAPGYMQREKTGFEPIDPRFTTATTSCHRVSRVRESSQFTTRRIASPPS